MSFILSTSVFGGVSTSKYNKLVDKYNELRQDEIRVRKSNVDQNAKLSKEEKKHRDTKSKLEEMKRDSRNVENIHS